MGAGSGVTALPCSAARAVWSHRGRFPRRCWVLRFPAATVMGVRVEARLVRAGHLLSRLAPHRCHCPGSGERRLVAPRIDIPLPLRPPSRPEPREPWDEGGLRVRGDLGVGADGGRGVGGEWEEEI